jgi:hypothetical protein
MARFIVRVELHGSNDYDSLHDAMKARGFSRKIKGTGAWFKLPSGMYRMDSDTKDRHDVLREAKAAAGTVDSDYSFFILVTESAGTVWTGLERL